jgi:hypothetical protein
VYCLNPTTTSCADLLHAITGSPDPMDTLSYNILQCSILFSNISSFLCCRATEAIECSCRATTTFTPLTEAGMLSRNNTYLTTSQRQVFAALLLPYPMLFSTKLGKYRHWLLPLSFVYTTKDAASAIFPTWKRPRILHARFTILRYKLSCAADSALYSCARCHAV